MDLEQFVEQQQAQGRRQSSGAFTISLAKAAEKLAKYRLPRPEAWVSLLVQAGVGWNCPELKVTQSRYETQFSFLEPTDGFPPRSDLLEGLDASRGVKTAIDRFCLALQSLVVQAGLSFLLHTSDSDGEGIFDGQHFAELAPEQRRSKEYRSKGSMTLTVCHLPTQERGWLQTLRARTHQLPILTELDSFAGYSVMPISVDGRRVVGDAQNPFLMGGCAVMEKRPTLPLPDFLGELDSLGALAALNLNAEPSPQPFRQFRLCWLRAGVLVQEQFLDTPSRGLRGVLILNGDGLATDLTGFQLQDDRVKTERERLSLVGLASTLKEARETLRTKQKLAEDAVKEDPGLLERAGLPFFTLLPAPLMAVGSMFLLFTPLFFFAGLGLGLTTGAVGAGLVKAGYWVSPSGIEQRRNAPLVKTRETFEMLGKELEALESELRHKGEA